MSSQLINFNESQRSLIQRIVVTSFVIVSCILFAYLNRLQSTYYIDEVFHIQQTQRYCEGRFFEWDPKITTFPGLYLIAVGILGPFQSCSTTCLRAVNLVGTFLNFYVIFKIFQVPIRSRSSYSPERTVAPNQWLVDLFASLNAVILPPLYFWSFFYYTDVISTNLVLLMLLFHLKKCFKSSALIGCLAVFIRQTNIIWVAMVGLERVIDSIDIMDGNDSHGVNTRSEIKLLCNKAIEKLRGKERYHFIGSLLSTSLPYVLVGLGFSTFLVWNGGIVLGDRSAHVATIHLPQIFYYAVFTVGFAWPYAVRYVYDFCKLARRRPILLSGALICMWVIVARNTLVHPYLLADNRHYTFYIWNRVMGPRVWVRFVLVPFYAFALYAIWRSLNHLRLTTQIGYYLSSAVVLVPQLLLEPRYFLIPYLIFRINLREQKIWQLTSEFLTVFALNVVQFYIFANKVFYWSDDDNPQRISW